MNSIVLQPDSSHTPPSIPIPRNIAASDREVVELAVERDCQIAFYLDTSPDLPSLRSYLRTENAAGLTVMLGQTRPLPQGLRRIRARQPEVIRRARKLRAVLGDPVAGLADVLQSIPVEDDVWDRIAQEPYG